MNSTELPLTHEHLKEMLIYDPETGVFTWRVNRSNVRAGSVAGSLDGKGYLAVRINGKLYNYHRLAWLYVYGRWPEKHIDHIDGNTLNNRINNLREATRNQNMWNRKIAKNNTSGAKGVSFCKGMKKWKAAISFYGKVTIIGYFQTVEEAAAAYSQKSSELFGDFSRTN